MFGLKNNKSGDESMVFCIEGKNFNQMICLLALTSQISYSNRSADAEHAACMNSTGRNKSRMTAVCVCARAAPVRTLIATVHTFAC